MQNFDYSSSFIDVAFSKDYQLRWFVDLIYGFTLIPERLLGIIQRQSCIITEYIIILMTFDTVRLSLWLQHVAPFIIARLTHLTGWSPPQTIRTDTCLIYL